jgi:hypothetical protein
MLEGTLGGTLKMPPANGWEFTDDGTDDRSVRTTLEKWVIAKIKAEAATWIAAASGTPIAFNRVDHYRGARQPSQTWNLEALFSEGQDPACWVSCWGSSSEQRTELSADWMIEVHCLIGCKIPAAANSAARTGTGEKSGLNRLIEIARRAMIGKKNRIQPSERHYTDGEVDATPIRLIGNEERTMTVRAIEQNAREIPIGFIQGIAAVDLVFTATAQPVTA